MCWLNGEFIITAFKTVVHGSFFNFFLFFCIFWKRFHFIMLLLSDNALRQKEDTSLCDLKINHKTSEAYKRIMNKTFKNQLMSRIIFIRFIFLEYTINKKKFCVFLRHNLMILQWKKAKKNSWKKRTKLQRGFFVVLIINKISLTCQWKENTFLCEIFCWT